MGLLPVLLLLSLVLGACSTGIYHEVKKGQNLYRISRAYGVSEATIAAANKISDPTRIQIGTRLYIPGADRVRPVAPAPAPRPVNSRISSTKSVPEVVKKPAKTSPQATKRRVSETAAARPKANSVKQLQWPLRGNIVRTFSRASTTGGGKGIEIAVRPGSAVAAAEAGKVIYSGNGVKGYGHLIILQHENDFFTVYGFNQRNLVKLGDFVSQGEKIAFSGTPPSGGQPRLHFEVRKGKQAVDPILYLP